VRRMTQMPVRRAVLDGAAERVSPDLILLEPLSSLGYMIQKDR